MKVWIAEREYEVFRVIGVFYTEESARDYCKKDLSSNVGLTEENYSVDCYAIKGSVPPINKLKYY